MHRVGNGLLIILFHSGFITSVVGGYLYPYIHSSLAPTIVIIMTSIIGLLTAASNHLFGWVISLFVVLAKALNSYETSTPHILKLGIKVFFSAIHLAIHFYFGASIKITWMITTFATLLLCGFKLVGTVTETLFLVPFILHQYVLVLVETIMTSKSSDYDMTSTVTLALIPIVFGLVALVTPHPPLSYRLMTMPEDDPTVVEVLLDGARRRS